MTLPALPRIFSQIFRLACEPLNRCGLTFRNCAESCGGDHEGTLTRIKVEAIEGRVLGVIETNHEWFDARLHHRTHALEPARDVGKRISLAGDRFGQAMHAKHRLE